MKKEVINAILMDDLKGAELLIAKKPEGFEILSSLLKKVKNKPIPLKTLTSKAPEFIVINASHTCGLQCEMCDSGYHDRTFLYDDYKYFLPKQFDKLSYWLSSASNIIFSGTGETLNSPYIDYFLSKITNKNSIVVTSGIPINKKKIQSFINAKLNILSLSFDGKLSVGHGRGTGKYIRLFWKKVELIQKMKKDFNSKLPAIELTIAVAGENLDNIENIIETASRHGITHILLSLIRPISKKMYYKSVFVRFDESKKRINSIISRCNKKGLFVSLVDNKKRMRDLSHTCNYANNWLLFHGRNNNLGFCCGSLDMPVCFSNIPQVNYWNSFPIRYFRYLYFCSNRKELPITCKNCWAMNLKAYSKRCFSLYNRSNNKKVYSIPLTIYNSASKMKQNSRNSRAEKLFLKVLMLKPDHELKGKVYFHLGEIELRKKDYGQSLRFMKLSVQYCFKHAMAFSYLYLLFMLLEKKDKKEGKN